MRRLTARQLQAVQAAADGLTVKQWARKIEVTPNTAAGHLEVVRFKLGVKSVAHAVAVCMRRGLIK